MEITIKKENAIAAFNKADTAGKALLEALLGKETFSQKITDRVKTFEDACAVAGEDPLNENFSTGSDDEIAYKKLKVVVKALNEGATLDYGNKNQQKWSPWFEYAGSGFRFLDTDCGCTDTRAAGGSRLCFKTEDLARYAGTQFIDLYNQFLK